MRPTFESLRAIHRAHLLTIPYENLDVQLGRPVGLSPAPIFDKIVRHGRGGWCYEMNGLLGWALEELGFRVTRCAGAVGRDRKGDAGIGNHLVLRVDLDEGTWLADVGFGDGPIDPIRIVPGEFSSHGFTFELTQADADWWRLHNHVQGGEQTFDFTLRAADESVLAARCAYLQTSEQSTFMQNLVAQRHTPAGVTTLRGRVLRWARPDGRTERLLECAEEFVSALKSEFTLDLPEAAGLWPAIVARHAEVFDPPLEDPGSHGAVDLTKYPDALLLPPFA
ncbi:MAG TPA: arylamine N-acetyltransferase [Gemmatimonadaceae bacterium]|nr:arylamine N-acetyltransferase [Gemmatimonadaceae bacterium]